MTIIKDSIIRNIYNQCGLSKMKSTEVVGSLLEIIKKTLESGEDVLISGFGKFCVKDKNERRGRNPEYMGIFPKLQIVQSSQNSIKKGGCYAQNRTY